MLALSTAVLKTIQGEAVALQNVNVQAALTDLMSNVSITQNYKNNENTNIEAVYTFALPLDAVLLDLTVTLGEKVLKGKIVEKKQAEVSYEEAITDGNSAIMLEQSQPGLFTMNVGNILAGESISITFHYGALHSYQNKSLRFMLPTTLAPRYGDPLQGGLDPHQVPEHKMTADYGFSLSVVIKGMLLSSDITCPTHPVCIQSENEQVVISLQKEIATMDRDLVLNFDNIKASASTARVEKDYHGYVALASFHCNFNIAEDSAPRSFKIVVDCSGSMSGDSIDQARTALNRILDSLRDGDYLNIIKFGSHYDILSDEQLCINKKSRTRIENYIQNIDANMGGTEMDGALTAAYKISSEMDMAHDVLLITDGEVWNEAELISNAKSSHHRIFTIGVGSSVAENIVRGLADATGGACELVTPNESMADKIHRHFKRMHTPRAKAVNVAWSQNKNSNAPTRCTPGKIRSVYAGDTLHVFGWFNEAPEGHMQLDVTLPDGTLLTDKSRYAPMVEKNENYFLTRMGSASLLKNESTIEDHIKAEMAVEYQLMTQWTNYLVVHVRTKDKAAELPELRTVPQTLAAGWGGTGSIAGSIMSECDATLDMSSVDFSESPVLHQAAPASVEKTEIHKLKKSRAVRRKTPPPMPAPVIPEEIIEETSVQVPEHTPEHTPESIIFENEIHLEDVLALQELISQQIITLAINLNEKINQLGEKGIASIKLADFKSLGAPDIAIDILESFPDSARSETDIVLSFFSILLDFSHRKYFDKQAIRTITWAYKRSVVNKSLSHEMKLELTCLLEDAI